MTISLKDPNCEYEIGMIRNIIETSGPRLPCSDAEKKGALLFAKELEIITNTPATIEEFSTAPYASIGMIPLIGYFLIFICVPLYYIYPLISALLIGITLLIAVAQIFRYTGLFDFLFPKANSQNIYTIWENAHNSPKKTIVLGSHIDSSWHCPIFEKNPKQTAPKIIYGVISAVILLFSSILKLVFQNSTFTLILNIIPLLLIPGFYFLTTYISYNKKKASPGAMDNLSGAAMSAGVLKEIIENPSIIPNNIRIIVASFGAEEAGIKGSDAFAKKHAKGLLKDAFVINIDSISDFEFIHIVNGDDWLGTQYDKEMQDIAEEAMKIHNIKYDIIKNPAGGTDSASFSRAGIRTITIAAQDPGPATNYHTYKDTLENMDLKTMKVLKPVIFEMIRLIGKKT